MRQICARSLALAVKRSDGDHFASLRETFVVRLNPKAGGKTIRAEVLDALGSQTGLGRVFIFRESLEKELKSWLRAMWGIGIVPEHRHDETSTGIRGNLPKDPHDIRKGDPRKVGDRDVNPFRPPRGKSSLMPSDGSDNPGNLFVHEASGGISRKMTNCRSGCNFCGGRP